MCEACAAGGAQAVPLPSPTDGSVVQLDSDVFKMGHPLTVPLLLCKNSCTLRASAGGVWIRTSYSSSHLPAFKGKGRLIFPGLLALLLALGQTE